MEGISALYYAVSTLLSVGALFVGLLLWRMRGEFVTKAAFEKLDDRVARAEQRVAVIESERLQSATRADVANVTTEIVGLRGDVQTQEARLEAVHTRIEDLMRRIEPSVQRIEQYLLDQAGKDHR